MTQPGTIDPPDPRERFARWAAVQWISLPRWLISHRPGLRGLAGDGHTLVIWPAVAAVSPALSLLVGLACGFLRLGYDTVYTESIVLMVVMLALGSFSSQLGLLAVSGLCLGDLITAVGPDALQGVGLGSSVWFQPPFTTGPLGSLVHVWLPRGISYLLLLAGAVMLPRAARAVIAGVGRGRAVPPLAAWCLVSGLLLVITWLGTGAWVAAAPTLVRPVFTWATSNGSPTVEAVATLQDSGGLVVAAAVTAAGLRQLLIGCAMLPGLQQERLLAAERTAPDLGRTAERPPGEASPLRQIAAALATSALATLAMAGILEQTWLWVAVFAVLLVIRLVRTRLIDVPGLVAWQRIVSVAPAWARLIVLWLASRVIVQGLSTTLIGSYTGLAVFVLVSIVAVFAVFPGDPPADREPARPVGAA